MSFPTEQTAKPKITLKPSVVSSGILNHERNKSHMFTPEFDNDVFVIGPTGIQHLNPKLYATQLSAHKLADQLADLTPTVVLDWPFALAPGSHFQPSKKVPFLLFPSGYRESAGSLQVWWVRVPEPEGLALRYCKEQIAADEKQYLADASPTA